MDGTGSLGLDGARAPNSGNKELRVLPQYAILHWAKTIKAKCFHIPYDIVKLDSEDLFYSVVLLSSFWICSSLRT